MLLDALVNRNSFRRYVPVDVSEETLRLAAGRIAAEFPAVDVHAIVGDFHRHLSSLPPDSRRLVAYLGSTIGNLDPGERARFFRGLRHSLAAGDDLLLGVDLVKDAGRLVAAYDDARGVTAEFNRNALRVLSRELAADFDPDLFDHVAVWDADAQQIEMRLRARIEHDVHLG